MKLVLPEAERLAKLDGAKVPAAEHLLLAAFTLDDGSGRRVLAAVGHDLDELIAALRVEGASSPFSLPATQPTERAESSGPADAVAPARRRAGIVRSSDSMQVMFQRVRKRAAAAKRPIREADFLAAAAQIDHGVIPTALAALGIAREQLFEATQSVEDG